MSNHKAKKRFGQNFLRDGNIINNIVRSIGPKEGQFIVEIGPGQGAITADLIDSGARVHCIELDRDLLPILRSQFITRDNWSLENTDALMVDYSKLAPPGEPIRVVGNLPYNISTPLIFKLLEHADIITDMYFMLQKEVVLRLCAGVGDNNYGRLSVMTQYYCDASTLFLVPPTAFTPMPKVDSAIVRLAPKKTRPNVANFKLFQDIVRDCFNQRRKTIRNSLKSRLSAEQMATLPVDITLRPENLSLDDYVALANAVDQMA